MATASSISEITTLSIFRGSENTIQLFDTLLQTVNVPTQARCGSFPSDDADASQENVLCLNLIQIEYGNQLRLRGISIVRRTNHSESLRQCRPSQAEGSIKCRRSNAFFFTEFATTANHHTTMVHPHLKHFLQTHGVRAAVDQRHIVDSEIVLQRRVLEQLRKHGVRIETGFDFNDKTSAVMTIRQVDRPGNTFQLAILHTRKYVPELVRPTMNGSSVTTMAYGPSLSFRYASLNAWSTRHVRFQASRTPLRPTITPPLGQSDLEHSA